MRCIVLCTLALLSCQLTFCQPGNNELGVFFKDYMEETYRLFPLNAVYNGDYRFNDLMPATFTDAYTETTRQYYRKYLNGIRKFDRSKLNANDRISYDIFKRDMEINLEGLAYNANQVPFTQFRGLPLQLGQLGSGTGAQPFKTVKDYEDWISRAKLFATWADSAIVYFKKGIAENNVMPRTLVVKMIPQLRDLQKEDVAKSVFYGPVTRFPSTFSDADKTRLTDAYVLLISQYLNPAYQKLERFIRDEYLPKARSTSGIGSTPDGHKKYDYFIRVYTTTSRSANDIYRTGLAEVKRIRREMEKVKRQVGFNGTLDSFFHYTKTAPQFLPYTSAEQVLEAYRAIEQKIEPNLPKLFTLRPKTNFEVRQTEAFRAASAAAQYNSGLPDGSRPGIFYVPIIDPTRYTTAKENLFIHEAIPGHHFQIMIQKENAGLPKFRQDGGNSAFSEGWALYCESLGRGLGCYTDPYQYFYALGDEMHRAIRLVVDAGMHAKGWTREAAIDYMRKNEPITEQSATSEVERYMSLPGQALSYKIGELKIKELRDRYAKQLGTKFSLAAFHDEILRDGNMPLAVLETKLNAWAASLQ